MRTILILAIIGQLCLQVDTLYPVNKQKNGSIGVCDVVGTHTDLTHTFIQRRTKQCICNPGFYGYRCERIYRCRSGRSVNISCSEPDEFYAAEASLRCIRGQVDLEVCECFVGYGGYLCEKAQEVMNPDYSAKLEVMEYDLRNDLAENNDVYGDKRILFSSNDDVDEEYGCYQNLHAFYGKLNGVGIFVLFLVTLLLLYLFVYSLKKLLNSREHKTAYVPVSTIQVPPNTECVAPPPYTKNDLELVKSEEGKSSRTSSESSNEFYPMPPSLRPYLHV